MKNIVKIGLTACLVLGLSGCAKDSNSIYENFLMQPTIKESISNSNYGVKLNDIPKCPEQKIIGKASSFKEVQYIDSIETITNEDGTTTTTPTIKTYKIGNEDEIKGCIDTDTKNGTQFLMINASKINRELVK